MRLEVSGPPTPQGDTVAADRGAVLVVERGEVVSDRRASSHPDR